MEDNEKLLPCSDKLSYESEKDAYGALVMAKHNYGGQMKIYKCRHCNLWHTATVYA